MAIFFISSIFFKRRLELESPSSLRDVPIVSPIKLFLSFSPFLFAQKSSKLPFLQIYFLLSGSQQSKHLLQFFFFHTISFSTSTSPFIVSPKMSGSSQFAQFVSPLFQFFVFSFDLFFLGHSFLISRFSFSRFVFPFVSFRLVFLKTVKISNSNISTVVSCWIKFLASFNSDSIFSKIGLIFAASFFNFAISFFSCEFS